MKMFPVGCLVWTGALVAGAAVGATPEPGESAQAEVISALPHLIRPAGLLFSVGFILVAGLLLRFVDRIVRHLSEVFADQRLTLHKVNTFFRFAVYLVTVVVVILLSFRVSTEVLAVLGGTVAVSLGFALKDLAASIVAGLLMLFDRPFQVGDRVNFGGSYGDVISIGMRSVKLQTLDDNIVTIPNNIFMTNVTSCGNYGVLEMLVVVDFFIAPDQDVNRATDLLREAAATSRYVYLPKPIVVRVSQQIVENHFCLRLRLKAYVMDTTYEKAHETDITLRVMEAFRSAGIQPPVIRHQVPSETG